MLHESRKKRVTKAIQEIKRLYRIGKQSLRDHKKKLPPGDELVALLDRLTRAEKWLVNLDKLWKARRLASKTHGYTREEMKALCKAIRGQASAEPNAPVFGVTHLCRLLTVPKEERAEMQQRAIEGGWGLTVLESAIAAKYGRRSFGGRRRRVPENPDPDDLSPADNRVALNTQIDRICDTWLRWYEGVQRPDEKSGRVPWDALSGQVQKRVQAARRCILALSVRVQIELVEFDERQTDMMTTHAQDGTGAGKRAPQAKKSGRR